MNCSICKRNLNHASKAEIKYGICSICGSKTFPNTHEVKIGMTVEIQVSTGYNKGQKVQGKLEKIETIGDWHYEGLMVVLDNGNIGRLKKIILDEDSQNYENSNFKMNEEKKDNSVIDNQIALNQKQISYADDEELIQPEDLYISKGQARLLKNLVKYMPDFGDNIKSENQLKEILESERYQIEDNWGSVENFLKLGTNYFEINKISAIILFEKLHEKLEHVPKKEEFFYNFPVDENWIKNEFQSWQHFLELLNYDPWYRDKKREFQKNKQIEKESEITESDYEIKIDKEQLDSIRETLKSHFRKMDLEQKQWEYKYENMFELLETYLKLLPNNKKYNQIFNFL